MDFDEFGNKQAFFENANIFASSVAICTLHAAIMKVTVY